jgi:hypothetical protein
VVIAPLDMPAELKWLTRLLLLLYRVAVIALPATALLRAAATSQLLHSCPQPLLLFAAA